MVYRNMVATGPTFGEACLARFNIHDDPIGINTGNYQNCWNKDQFKVDIRDITLALIELLPSGGFDTVGFNFDARFRRQS